MPVASLDEWILATVAEMCQQDPRNVTEDTTVLDIGLDSLALSMLLAQVETNWKCELTETDMARLFEALSLRDLIAVVRSAIPVQGPPGLADTSMTTS